MRSGESKRPTQLALRRRHQGAIAILICSASAAGDVIDVCDILQSDAREEGCQHLNEPFCRERKGAWKEASSNGHIEKPTITILKANPHADAATDHAVLNVAGLLDGRAPQTWDFLDKSALKGGSPPSDDALDICTCWLDAPVAQKLLEIRIGVVHAPLLVPTRSQQPHDAGGFVMPRCRAIAPAMERIRNELGEKRLDRFVTDGVRATLLYEVRDDLMRVDKLFDRATTRIGGEGEIFGEAAARRA